MAGLLGCDCSEFQNKPDWNLVAQTKSFAIIRASYGTSHVDKSFDYNMSQLVGHRTIGLGVYQYVLPQSDTVGAHVAILQRLINAHGGYRPGMKLMCDIEDPGSGGNLEPWLFEWLTEVRLFFNARTEDVMWYSYGPYMRQHGLTTQRLKQFPQWFADYTYPNDPSNPLVQPPSPAGPWKCWQYSNKGSVPGIAGNVDLNWWDGPISDFFPAAPPGPPPAPPEEVDVQRDDFTLNQGQERLSLGWSVAKGPVNWNLAAPEAPAGADASQPAALVNIFARQYGGGEIYHKQVAVPFDTQLAFDTTGEATEAGAPFSGSFHFKFVYQSGSVPIQVEVHGV